MFIGHYGLAFAAKRAAPQTSLGTLFLSAQLVDGIWPVFLLAGVEHVRIVPGITRMTPLDFYDYPYTHSLACGAGWALALGLIYFAARKYARGAWVVAALVVSHWFLDAVVHRHDLPLYPGGSKLIGLGLWNSAGGTLAGELAIFSLGLWAYARATRATGRAGFYALWSLVAFLLLAWLGAMFGPPPPSVRALALTGLAGWLIVPWGYWIDRGRRQFIRR